MPDNTLTFELEGDVSLTEFANALIDFKRLVDALSREVAENAAIEWLVDDLQSGSALATVAGYHPEEAPVHAVIGAYEKVAEALHNYAPVPYSQTVARQAYALTRHVQEKITALRLQTAQVDYVYYGGVDASAAQSFQPRVAYGSVRGRVQAISSRGRLKFNLYDSIFDKLVTCYLQEGQEEEMKDYWRELVMVTGDITRDVETGRAKTVRNITSVARIQPVRPGSYKQARGVLAWMDDEPAEVTIRRLWDAEWE